MGLKLDGRTRTFNKSIGYSLLLIVPVRNLYSLQISVMREKCLLAIGFILCLFIIVNVVLFISE